jgi:hypothetical protein
MRKFFSEGKLINSLKGKNWNSSERREKFRNSRQKLIPKVN